MQLGVSVREPHPGRGGELGGGGARDTRCSARGRGQTSGRGRGGGRKVLGLGLGRRGAHIS